MFKTDHFFHLFILGFLVFLIVLVSYLPKEKLGFENEAEKQYCLNLLYFCLVFLSALEFFTFYYGLGQVSGGILEQKTSAEQFYKSWERCSLQKEKSYQVCLEEIVDFPKFRKEFFYLRCDKLSGDAYKNCMFQALYTHRRF